MIWYPTQTATGTGGAWIGTARTLTGIPTGTALRTATVAVAGLKGEGPGTENGHRVRRGLAYLSFFRYLGTLDPLCSYG